MNKWVKTIGTIIVIIKILLGQLMKLIPIFKIKKNLKLKKAILQYKLNLYVKILMIIFLHFSISKKEKYNYVDNEEKGLFIKQWKKKTKEYIDLFQIINFIGNDDPQKKLIFIQINNEKYFDDFRRINNIKKVRIKSNDYND